MYNTPVFALLSSCRRYCKRISFVSHYCCYACHKNILQTLVLLTFDNTFHIYLNDFAKRFIIKEIDRNKPITSKKKNEFRQNWNSFLSYYIDNVYHLLYLCFDVAFLYFFTKLLFNVFRFFRPISGKNWTGNIMPHSTKNTR